MYTQYQILSIMAGIFNTNPDLYSEIIAGKARNTLARKVRDNLAMYKLDENFIHTQVNKIIEDDKKRRKSY